MAYRGREDDDDITLSDDESEMRRLRDARRPAPDQLKKMKKPGLDVPEDKMEADTPKPASPEAQSRPVRGPARPPQSFLDEAARLASKPAPPAEEQEPPQEEPKEIPKLKGPARPSMTQMQESVLLMSHHTGSSLPSNINVATRGEDQKKGHSKKKIEVVAEPLVGEGSDGEDGGGGSWMTQLPTSFGKKDARKLTTEEIHSAFKRDSDKPKAFVNLKSLIEQEEKEKSGKSFFTVVDTSAGAAKGGMTSRQRKELKERAQAAEEARERGEDLASMKVDSQPLPPPPQLSTLTLQEQKQEQDSTPISREAEKSAQPTSTARGGVSNVAEDESDDGEEAGPSIPMSFLTARGGGGGSASTDTKISAEKRPSPENSDSDNEEQGPQIIVGQKTQKEKEFVRIEPSTSGSKKRGAPRLDKFGVEISDSEGEGEGGQGAESEDEGEERGESLPPVPMSHEMVLRGHGKLVSALAIDPMGARVLSGSYDHTVKMWDFAGMDKTSRFFREIVPQEGYTVNQINYSMDGKWFIVASDNTVPVLFNRDGFRNQEFMKGDQYIADMANTKGHVAAVVQAQFHPGDNDVMMTASSDSTVRIWDVRTCTKQQRSVIKCKNGRSLKTPVTAASYSSDGTLIGAACLDGSVQIWSEKAPHVKPQIVIRTAHAENTHTSSISFSKDRTSVLTRGGDDTMKHWDLRNTSRPLHTFSDLPNFHALTDCLFSPDNRYLVTGTSAKRGSGQSGSLAFFDRTNGELVRKIGVAENESAIRVVWNGTINQLLVGCSDSLVHVLYDPSISKNGALLSVRREPRKKDVNDFLKEMAQPRIKNPGALPMFRDAPSRARQAIKDRKDPKKSHKPEPPVPGVGIGGRVGTSRTHDMMLRILDGKKVGEWREQDPREAILKHAAEAEADPMWSTAWKKTQPKAIYDMTPEPEKAVLPPPKKKKLEY